MPEVQEVVGSRSQTLNGPGESAGEIAVMTKKELRTLLMDCAEKLNLYRGQHSGEYIGGVEYMELQRRIVKALDELPADEPSETPTRYYMKGALMIHRPPTDAEARALPDSAQVYMAQEIDALSALKPAAGLSDDVRMLAEHHSGDGWLDELGQAARRILGYRSKPEHTHNPGQGCMACEIEKLSENRS